MTEHAQAYPLDWPDGWPRTPSAQQGRSRFSSTYERACRKLIEEVRMLGGKHLVVSSNIPVTRQGTPYADYARRKIDDPGVAVYFLLKGKQMAMARDAYWSVHENMMSLAHAIEHMRGLSRHGGDHMMTQAFSGFAALPAPETAKPKRPWFIVLGLSPDTDDKHMIEMAYRVKAKKAHPDAGGTADAMAELNQAKEEALSTL